MLGTVLDADTVRHQDTILPHLLEVFTRPLREAPLLGNINLEWRRELLTELP